MMKFMLYALTESMTAESKTSERLEKISQQVLFILSKSSIQVRLVLKTT